MLFYYTNLAGSLTLSMALIIYIVSPTAYYLLLLVVLNDEHHHLTYSTWEPDTVNDTNKHVYIL